MKRIAWIHTLAISIPVLLLWTLYMPAQDSWWTCDDPFVLKTLFERGTFSHFVDPLVWKGYSLHSFTPWMHLSYALDLRLFGLNPAGFYFHQLLSFSLVIALAYGILRICL